MPNKKKIFAQAQPDGDGYQVSYETIDSRRVHRFPTTKQTSEAAPHGAGSYHDPEQHHTLMERVDAFLRKTTP